MADQTLARLVNERRILTQLRQNATLSRAALARRLSLTPSTITNLVDGLLQEGLVVEVGVVDLLKEARGLGRPSVGLALNREGAYFLGVEIGVGIMRFALIDLALDPVMTSTACVDPRIDPSAALEIVAGRLRHLVRARPSGTPIRTVCLTVPGLVRSDGYVVHLPILGWKDVNFLGMAGERLGLPVLVENNANAAAFGEIYTRHAVNPDCILYLKPGMGLGGAAIVNGRLLRGAGGMAAEFGHIRVGSGRITCSCGAKGCLETLVTLPALGRAYDPMRDWSSDELRALPMIVVADAAAGNQTARAAMAAVLRDLGAGLVTLINSLNPSLVVLGGAMRPVIEHGIGKLRRAVETGIVPGMMVPEIELSTLGEFECAVGVAAIAHHQAFDISNLEVADGQIPDSRMRPRADRTGRQTTSASSLGSS